MGSGGGTGSGGKGTSHAGGWSRRRSLSVATVAGAGGDGRKQAAARPTSPCRTKSMATSAAAVGGRAGGPAPLMLGAALPRTEGKGVVVGGGTVGGNNREAHSPRSNNPRRRLSSAWGLRTPSAERERIMRGKRSHAIDAAVRSMAVAACVTIRPSALPSLMPRRDCGPAQPSGRREWEGKGI